MRRYTAFPQLDEAECTQQELNKRGENRTEREGVQKGASERSRADRRKKRVCEREGKCGRGGSFQVFYFILSFCLFRAAPKAYGGSQARGPIGATGASLPHSHGNVGSEPRLRPTPQLTATLDP